MAGREASLTIVVDASMAAAWLLPGEGDHVTDRVLQHVKTSGGIAPSIFRHEVRSIMLIAEPRKRITSAIDDALLLRLATLPIEDDGPGDDAEVVSLARVHELTAYDAYLALAASAGLLLATLDRALAGAARACGVPLLGPLAP